MTDIAENLKRLRAAAGMSQTALAQKQVSQQLISQLEAGVNARTKELPALAAALGVAVHEIDSSCSVLSTDGQWRHSAMLDRGEALEDIGWRLRMLREALGYRNSAQFAAYVGWTPQQLNNYEAGRKRPEVTMATGSAAGQALLSIGFTEASVAGCRCT